MKATTQDAYCSEVVESYVGSTLVEADRAIFGAELFAIRTSVAPALRRCTDALTKSCEINNEDRHHTGEVIGLGGKDLMEARIGRRATYTCHVQFTSVLRWGARMAIWEFGEVIGLGTRVLCRLNFWPECEHK